MIVLNEQTIKTDIDNWIKEDTIRQQKEDYKKSMSYSVSQYLQSMDYWSHLATIRAHFKLNSANANTLMDRASKHPHIRKIFWVLESDINSYNHLHVLLYWVDNDNDMKAMRGRLNTAMGFKPNSGVVGYIDKIEQEKLRGICNYTCKHINTNSIYGFHL